MKIAFKDLPWDYLKKTFSKSPGDPEFKEITLDIMHDYHTAKVNGWDISQKRTARKVAKILHPEDMNDKERMEARWGMMQILERMLKAEIESSKNSVVTL